MSSRIDITVEYDGRFSVYLADIENMDIKIRFLGRILERLSPTDRGKIELTGYRRAAVRLENTHSDG